MAALLYLSCLCCFLAAYRASPIVISFEGQLSTATESSPGNLAVWNWNNPVSSSSVFTADFSSKCCLTKTLTETWIFDSNSISSSPSVLANPVTGFQWGSSFSSQASIVSLWYGSVLRLQVQGHTTQTPIHDGTLFGTGTNTLSSERPITVGDSTDLWGNANSIVAADLLDSNGGALSFALSLWEQNGETSGMLAQVQAQQLFAFVQLDVLVTSVDPPSESNGLSGGQSVQINGQQFLGKVEVHPNLTSFL